MACGYNGARLHQKVFEPRFLYWADKLGYLVWGEFPNWGYNYKARRLRPLCHRMDGSPAPRPQPSGDHRLVPLQRERGGRRRDPAGDLERDQGRRSRRVPCWRAAAGRIRCRIPRSATRTTTTATLSPPQAVDGLFRRCAGGAVDAAALRFPTGRGPRFRRAVHDQRDRRDWLGHRGGLGLRRGSEDARCLLRPLPGHDRRPAWTTRTCSDSATRN